MKIKMRCYLAPALLLREMRLNMFTGQELSARLRFIALSGIQINNTQINYCHVLPHSTLNVAAQSPQSVHLWFALQTPMLP